MVNLAFERRRQMLLTREEGRELGSPFVFILSFLRFQVRLHLRDAFVFRIQLSLTFSVLQNPLLQQVVFFGGHRQRHE